MKKSFTILAVAALVAGISFKGATYISIPPTSMTGAPGESNCTSCHSGNANSGPGSVALVNPPLNYVPGTAYTLQVKVTDATKSRFGFEMVALNSSNQQAGSFTLVTSTNTALQTAGTKKYVSHKNATNNSLWSVIWTAPATDVGPVTFYLAGNGANANTSDTGDNIYTASLAITALATGISEDKNNLISIAPNPASSSLNLKLAGKANSLKVLDITGREMHRTNAFENTAQLDVSKYPNGTYFLQMDQDKTTLMKRFIVQH